MSLGIFTARKFRPGSLHAVDIRVSTKAERWAVQRSVKRFFHSSPSPSNNPQEPHSRIVKSNVKTWWRQNQSAIIQAINHDIQGAPASKGDTQWKRHFIFANGTLEVSHEEEDPFIVAEGREEDRFSVWLMSMFWKIHFSQIGEMEVVSRKDPHFIALNNSEIILARVSCQLFQQLHVFKQVDTTYKGWLYLYLRPSQKPPSSDSEFQIPIKYSIWNYYKLGENVVEAIQGVQRKAVSLLSPKT